MKGIPWFINLIILSLVAAGLIGVFREAWTTVFISTITLLLTMYTLNIYIKHQTPLAPGFFFATIFFLYATLFLGEVHNFYERFWWWDAILHAGSGLGFGLIGTIILIMMFRRQKIKASPLAISLFAFSLSMAIGAVWEIFEFGMDQLFNFNMQKTGLVDTMYDLIVNSIGALIASFAGYRYLTKKKTPGLYNLIAESVRRK